MNLTDEAMAAQFTDQCLRWAAPNEACVLEAMVFPIDDALRELVGAPADARVQWKVHLMHDRTRLRRSRYRADQLQLDMHSVLGASFDWPTGPDPSGSRRTCTAYLQPSTGELLKAERGLDCRGYVVGRPIGVEHRRSAPTVRGRAARWASIAADEDEASEAFRVHLAELRSLGAPKTLRARARRAMREERKHCEIALGMASRLAGRPIALGDRAEPAVPRRGRMEILESVARDGAVNETLSYGLLLAEAEKCTDPEERRAIKAIAVDEASHAALAWDTLAWVWPALSLAEQTRLAEVMTAVPGVSSKLGYLMDPMGVVEDLASSVLRPLAALIASSSHSGTRLRTSPLRAAG